jgi:hypothetical protein
MNKSKNLINPMLMVLTGLFGFGVTYAIGDYILFPEMGVMKSFVVCVVTAFVSVILIVSGINEAYSSLKGKK